ncbi:hypothetical protein VaNZ11_007413 [Volvox africanus]|uniref:Protein kinase domain-containing protein n=1 Tax=Volvox africanus TaxID=51714 RepID=A0ABQ5S2T7_9CHLO|nr:hypothetical protein VaNZ11_007413 [Volvox africanus]
MALWLFLFFSFLNVHPCVTGRAVGLVTSVIDIVNALRDPSVEQVFLGSGVFAWDTLSASAVAGGLVIGPNRQVELVGSVTVQQLSNNSKWPQPQALQFASGIDFGNTGQGIFKLADNTTLGFRNLFIWHGLSQLGYDAQIITLAQPGVRAAIRFTQCAKLRDGCLPLQIFVQHVTSYTRLADRAVQTASLQPFCYVPPPGTPASWMNSSTSDYNDNINVTCMAEVLAIDDLATSITRFNGQSYDLYERNVTYWCRAYASMSCLSASGPEQCVKELLSNTSLFNTSITASPPRSPEGSSAQDGDAGGNNLTNILLPAVITGGLALAFVFATVWCIRRRGVARRGSSLPGPDGHPGMGFGADFEAGGRAGRPGRGMGARIMQDALARLLPAAAAREAQRRKPYVPGYVPVVSKEALDRIAKVRAELSSKMVVASSGDDLSDVRNLHLVGKGTFGRVYKGEWKGVTVALKVISVPVSQYGQAQWQHVLGEAAISTLLNHPCVLQTYSVALLEYSPATKPVSSTSEDVMVNTRPSERGGSNSGQSQKHQQQQKQQKSAPNTGTAVDDMVPFYQLKMVSEFCDGGSVVHALRRMQYYDAVSGGMLRLPAVIDIASQVASGMAYLHSANIIHADLKAANVLLKQQPGSGRLQAKVGDFGLSFRLEEPEATHVTKGQLGSITHMAPEVLLHGRVSKASDVYSFGVLLYELYTGEQAYLDIPQPMLAYHVATSGGRPVLPPHCPPAYRGLAKACWASEPTARPTFEEVYRWLQRTSEGVNTALRSTTTTGRASRRDAPQDVVDLTIETFAAAAATADAAVPPGVSIPVPINDQLLPAPATSTAQVDAAVGPGHNIGCVAPPPSQEPNAVPLLGAPRLCSGGTMDSTGGMAAAPAVSPPSALRQGLGPTSDLVGSSAPEARVRTGSPGINQMGYRESGGEMGEMRR